MQAAICVALVIYTLPDKPALPQEKYRPSCPGAHMLNAAPATRDVDHTFFAPKALGVRIAG
jgi:hypothetical protein